MAVVTRYFLKLLLSSLIFAALSIIFNLSLQTGIPEIGKTLAAVLPVFRRDHLVIHVIIGLFLLPALPAN
jgi:hypothetical protein